MPTASSAKKAPAKKAAAKKAPPKKKAAPAKKAAVKRAAVKKKAPAKKAPAKKALAKKAGPAKKTAAVKKKAAPAKKAAASKAPAKKAAAAKESAPAKKAPAKKAAPAKKPAPSKKAAPPKKKPKPLDRKFLESQRELLLHERKRLWHDVETLDAEADELALMREPGDAQFDEESGEGDTLAVERERDLALSAQFRSQIEDIDHALAKIDVGTYGFCEVSGLLIPKDRLRAIPWARERVEYKVGGFQRR